MAAEQEALRRQIVEKRGEIAEDLDRLEAELRQTYARATDWRRHIRSRPLLAVGAGLGLGFLLGLVAGSFAG